ncbi:PDZ domain-containing protein [Pseudomonas nunensis]|uniref:PDZ domain-containing protein n=1 Tax=Pseudomonas nunensis TaxID=2961896 RepID=UPI0025AFD972|nr:PDZ domain-containing protein [Pseudomonas nunensis]MDN3223891.1 PDZ domain-containing protein [Pseudomonas nunensis]
MTRPLVKTLLLACAYFLVSGCTNTVNPYNSYYSSAVGLTPEYIAKTRMSPPPETPLVDHGNYEDLLEKNLTKWARQGYGIIGTAAFNSGSTVPDKLAIDQGKTVKADLVVIQNPKYVGSFATSAAVIKPTVSTSVGSTSIVGANGLNRAVASGSSSTYSTTTDYVPVTQHRADYSAFYLVRNTTTFGVRTIDLDEKERHERQSNYGVKATMIIDDSPAYKADLLSGDILEELDGQKISNSNALSNLIAERKGKTVVLTFSRDGKTSQKTILFNK